MIYIGHIVNKVKHYVLYNINSFCAENALRHILGMTLTVNTGSGNGLLPSGNKPLPEPILTTLTNIGAGGQ